MFQNYFLCIIAIHLWIILFGFVAEFCSVVHLHFLQTVQHFLTDIFLAAYFIFFFLSPNTLKETNLSIFSHNSKSICWNNSDDISHCSKAVTEDLQIHELQKFNSLAQHRSFCYFASVHFMQLTWFMAEVCQDDGHWERSSSQNNIQLCRFVLMHLHAFVYMHVVEGKRVCACVCVWCS